MKDVVVYFSEEDYAAYRNKSIAIGFTSEQKQTLGKLEKFGIDCDLKESPLSQMTKVRFGDIAAIAREPEGFGVYVRRGRRLMK